MSKEKSSALPLFIGLCFIVIIFFTSIGFLIILRKNGLPNTLGTNTQIPEPTPQLQLDSLKKYEVPTDLKGLLTPTPGSDKINFEPDLTPTPTPNPLFGEGKDIKLDGLN